MLIVVHDKICRLPKERLCRVVAVLTILFTEISHIGYIDKEPTDM